MDVAVQINAPTLPESRAMARLAERLGFHAVYFADHLVAEGPERQREPRPAYDPMILATVAAEATERIRVGHLVLCNLFRHPALTARAIATLDELSGGRAVLGLGSGWTETEFRMTGLAFPEIGARLRMLDEALTCIRGLWRETSFSFEGEFYRFEAAALSPRPVQRPAPPIILGGSGRGLLRIAARHADVVNIISEMGREGYVSLARARALTNDSFRAKVEFLRAEAVRAGRDPDALRVSGGIFNLSVLDTPEASRTLVERIASRVGAPPAAVRAAPLFLVGTPAECAAELQRREREWGLADTVLAGRITPETLERFGRDVLPLLAR